MSGFIFALFHKEYKMRRSQVIFISLHWSAVEQHSIMMRVLLLVFVACTMTSASAIKKVHVESKQVSYQAAGQAPYTDAAVYYGQYSGEHNALSSLAVLDACLVVCRQLRQRWLLLQ
jgi:hypothetical protein